MERGVATDEAVRAHLRRAGVRLTGPRQAVIAALAEAERALTLKEILERARRRRPQMGLATVYRVVDLLQGLGLLRQVHYEAHGCQRYFLALPGHHHQLVCRECGRVVEFPCEGRLSELEGELELDTGFRIEDHLLQFYGLCPEHRAQQVEGRDDESKGWGD